MLKALELENFKAFGERTRFEFAPITLIFGENSAGKSSILHALSLLKQTQDLGGQGELLLPRVDGGLIDLGSFQEFLFDHDEENRILHIRVESLAAAQSHIHQMKDGEISEVCDTVGYEMSFQRDIEENEVCLTDISLYTNNDDRPLFQLQPIKEIGTEQDKLLLGLDPDNWGGMAFDVRRGATCSAFDETSEVWKGLFKLVKEFQSDIAINLLNKWALRNSDYGESDFNEQLFLDVADPLVKERIKFYRDDFSFEQFIDHLRELYSRLVFRLRGFIIIRTLTDELDKFEWEVITRIGCEANPGDEEDQEINDIFKPGSLLTAAGKLLMTTLRRLFPLGPYRLKPERVYFFSGTTPRDVGNAGQFLPHLLFNREGLRNKVNEWFDRLELGYHIETIPIYQRSGDAFEIRLKDTRRDSSADFALSDVGFGVSQLLPFIAQSLAGRDRIITIEQPEVHIHPRLQADLGDLLAEGVKKPRNHQFIIETHSEHLVLRMQKLVREGDLTPDQVSVLFVSRGKDGSSVRRLRLDANGDFIDNWPGGFFPERLRELT